jgi:acyl carrier protein
MQKPNDTFSSIQRIIAEVTGNELEDITLDAEFEEELGIDAMTELPVIWSKVQREFDIILPIAVVRDCATVAELVELVDDERDL